MPCNLRRTMNCGLLIDVAGPKSRSSHHSLVQMEHVFQTPHNKNCNRKRGHKIEHEHTAATSARRPVPLCHFIPSHPSKLLRTPYPDVGNFTRPLQAPRLADKAISRSSRGHSRGLPTVRRFRPEPLETDSVSRDARHEVPRPMPDRGSLAGHGVAAR